MPRIVRVACLVVATAFAGALSDVAAAQTFQLSPGSSPSPSASAVPAEPAKPAGQGIAVLAVGPARDEAFALARAIYGSRLRPVTLDEIRARVLAGAPPPATASRELRELAELRAGVTGEDAAGRRLLSGLAQQIGAQALLVVKVEPAPTPAPLVAPPPPPPPPAAASGADAGAATDGGPAAAAVPSSDPGAGAGNLSPRSTVVARLFLADSAEFDAARYSPEPGLEGAAAWKSTVVSLEARFPAASRTVGPGAATAPAPGPVKLRAEDEKAGPFYTTAWFWGAIGGAALLGAGFYFASRDTTDSPIHLQMRVPK